MTTKRIIEQDICATCMNVCLLEPPPPTGPWEKKALCTAGWPYTRVFASANAIDECPQYERTHGVEVPAEVDRDTDGELLIDWSPGPGRMVTLSLRADGRLAYAFHWDGEKSHGTAQMPPGVMAAPPDEVQRAKRAGFMFGFKAAAMWANRDDLIADIGSPAYERDCDAACGVKGLGE